MNGGTVARALIGYKNVRRFDGLGSRTPKLPQKPLEGANLHKMLRNPYYIGAREDGRD